MKYLAYGSNMNHKQMARRCPGAECIGLTEIEDMRLVFAGRSQGAVATIEKAPGFKVPAMVWKITPEHEKALDRYEGFPGFYGKEKFEVWLRGDRVKIMAYVMSPGHVLGAPDDSYLQGIREGYEMVGFDQSVLDEAVRYSTELYGKTYDMAAELSREQTLSLLVQHRSLFNFCMGMHRLVDKYVQQAIEDGQSHIDYADVESDAEQMIFYQGLSSFDRELFTDMLSERPEIAEVDVTRNEIYLTLAPEFVQEPELGQSMK